jgi:asparagine synthase (glutamine-hydrolysing)
VVRATSLFDAGVTSRLISDHKDKRINAGYQLWGLLTLFLWLKRWDIEIPPSVEKTVSRPAAFAAAS